GRVRMKRWFGGVLAALVLLVGVVAVAFAVSHSAGAEDAKSGPWRAMITLSICGTTCDQHAMNPEAMKDMANFNDMSPAGDPNGSPMYAINVIAKLEQDGCEWQWQPYGTESDRVVILFRC
ncbi:MAG: hypothetical protein WBA46_08580, partial [Thermomicrobiales bacterium]